MSSDHSSDFEENPAKMFVGLFVLIVVLAAGFLVIRLISNPNSGDGTSGDNSVFNETQNTGPRDVDGRLIGDPLGSGMLNDDDVYGPLIEDSPDGSSSKKPDNFNISPSTNKLLDNQR